MADPIQEIQAVVGERYRVDREIGTGGMATVYLAEDSRYGRQVAIKVMSSSAASAISTERFLREIRLVANLQHPHILPLYDSGEANGILYYVMPFVSGGTLRARMDRGAMVPIAEATRLVTEVAEALDCAHRQGVVHRDVKPENILLSNGHALVADFGIARARQETDGVQLTETGLALGTPAYMSPEQITQSSPVDARSDVYSLGCLLYELLTGMPPFTGPSGQAVLVQQVTREAAPPQRSDEPIPNALIDAVLRSLAKDPSARPVSAAEFAESLRAGIASAAISAVVAPPAATVVVLPFENASPDPNDSYFATGLTDEVISDLSKVKAIRVISRASSMQLRGTTKDLRTIAGELKVRYAVTASVRRSGEMLRIVAELVDTATDTSLWSEKYTGAVANVFELQEYLSRQIVAALRVTVTPEESERIGVPPGEDARTLRCIVAAREAYHAYDPVAVERAKVLLYETLEEAPNNPKVLGWLATLYAHTVNVGRGDASTLAVAHRIADKAIALGPDVFEGYYAKGYAAAWLHGARAAIPWFRRALERERSPESLMLAYNMAQAGVALDEVVTLADEGVARDPLVPQFRWIRACVLLWCGDAMGARNAARDLAATGWPLADLIAGGVYLFAGDTNSALEHFKRSAVNEHMPVYAQWAPLIVQLLEKGTASPPTSELIDFCANADPWAAEWMATYWALAGDKPQALRWMHIAINRGFTNHLWWSDWNPIMSPYRDDPEFHELVSRAQQVRETEPL